MSCLLVVHSDIGIKKSTNQDSVLAVKADTDMGEISLIAVCDGMGGFAKGELASATVIRALNDWFANRLTYLVGSGFSDDGVRREWNDLLKKQNEIIKAYGAVNGISLGTTIVAALFYGNRYIICNLGGFQSIQIEQWNRAYNKRPFICSERDRCGKNDRGGSRGKSSAKRNIAVYRCFG